MAVAVGRAALLLVWLAMSQAFAAPPENVAPDPQLQAWFGALRQPVTKRPCYAVSDCRFVPFRIQNGHYEVRIEGWSYAVPAETIIEGIANPTGRAVACYTYATFGPPFPPGVPHDRPQDAIEILCFVPPRLPS